VRTYKRRTEWKTEDQRRGPAEKGSQARRGMAEGEEPPLTRNWSELSEGLRSQRPSDLLLHLTRNLHRLPPSGGPSDDEKKGDGSVI